MKKRQEKIKLLARLERGRAASPSFLTELSGVLGEPVESDSLQSLPDTDALMQAFRDGYRSAMDDKAINYRKLFGPTERLSVLRIADCIAEQLTKEDAFFLTNLSNDCGAVRLNISTLLRHTASILRLDGDSLSALSSDQTQGVLIDHNPDDPLQTFEVVVWGDRWSLVVLGCSDRATEIIRPR